MNLRAHTTVASLVLNSATTPARSHMSLDETYGVIYHSLFDLQTTARPTSKDAFPLRGGEIRRNMSSYYSDLGGDDEKSSSSGPSQNFMQIGKVFKDQANPFALQGK